MIKVTVIEDFSPAAFSEKVSEFIQDKPNYSIQYRPVSVSPGTVRQMALVTYTVPLIGGIGQDGD